MVMRVEDYRRRQCSGQLDLFYGPWRETADARHYREQQARRLCMRCPVRVACLNDELDRTTKHGNLFGFRAGLTEDERRDVWLARYPDRHAQEVRAREGSWYYDLVTA